MLENRRSLHHDRTGLGAFDRRSSAPIASGTKLEAALETGRPRFVCSPPLPPSSTSSPSTLDSIRDKVLDGLPRDPANRAGILGAVLEERLADIVPVAPAVLLLGMARTHSVAAVVEEKAGQHVLGGGALGLASRGPVAVENGIGFIPERLRHDCGVLPGVMGMPVAGLAE